MKRKQDQIAGHSPWEIEEAYYVNHWDIDPDVARICTIIGWMEQGDLRPLAAAIKQGQALDQDVLYFLSELIADDRLTIKRRRGGPKKPNLIARDIVANREYKFHAKFDKSDEAFAKAAKALGRSTQTVRQAVTRMRKMQGIPKRNVPLVVEPLRPRRTLK
jgi:hypothetical protein